KHEWFSVQELDEYGNKVYTWSAKDTPVSEAQVTTGADGKASASFTPDEGGTYKILVTGQDSGGRAVRASTYVWVTSNNYVNWRVENDDRITLVSDRRDYQPGDTAEILIPSPFQGSAVALVTVERGRILQYEVITLSSNSTVYRLPITEAFAPDVFVSVVLVKGVDADNPAPGFKVGVVKLQVSNAARQINVTLTPDRAKVGPRDMVRYTLQAADHRGQPVRAEFSLALADLAALSLADPNSAPILDYFYGQRGLGVRTAMGLVLNVNRLTEAAARAKGGGGGGGEGAFFEVRSQFLDTAFWRADVVTDANGQASVEITLPDNLTTWRLDARGVTADTLVGQSTVDIVATRDLLIRPVSPRVFVVGDQTRIGAVVNNNTGGEIPAEVSLEAAGLTLQDPAVQSVTVPARGRVQVNWTVTVQDVEAVDATFSVSGGGLADASKPPLGLPPDRLLPVYRYTTPETVGTAGQLESAASVVEGISLPRRFDVTQGELSIELNPSLAAGLTEGLTYLRNSPYDSTEDTVSRFLPNVLTLRALDQLGISDPALRDTLAALVDRGLQKLYHQQHADGGWGWYPSSPSDPYISAYVVFGLARAEQSGFPVSRDALKAGGNYLISTLRAPAELAQTWQMNRQMFVLYALAETGRGDQSRTVAMYDVRQRLGRAALGYLALTLASLDPNDARIPTLLSDLNNSAVLSATGAHWEEDSPDWWNMGTDI
ncbi:MAG: alpha-2-macroglobulin, partial [Chloroflexi bacterium]|nr:alpha-2-macroglobulin [Chloroflexota bacterium]